MRQASTTFPQAPLPWLARLRLLAARHARIVAARGVLDYRIATALALGGLVLYVVTLAPTVSWGDDATLQLNAIQGRFQASAGSHPAWTLFAHLFTKLPVGELAYRVNLASAFAAAVTLGLIYLIGRAAGCSRYASLAATAAFGVSHTFWAHAVRPEVYTLTLATLALVTWAAFQWYRCGQRRYLALIGAGWGIAFSTHVLALLAVPALAFLLISQRSRLKPTDWALLVGSGLLALVPYAAVLWSDFQRMQGNLLSLAKWALFTFDGYDFRHQMARFSLSGLLNDGAQWAAFLTYQFAGLGLLFGGLGVALTWRRWPRVQAIFAGLLYVIPALFAFSYDVGDRYVFYLPSYLPCALWLAVGVDGWQRRRRLNAAPRGHVGIRLALLVLLTLVPVGVYRVTPEVMGRFEIQFRDARYVPGPNSRYFLLWPPKANYYDARDYAEAALTSAPADALLLAEPMLASPMQFLQQAESLRPDVLVRFCCWDIEQTLAAESGRSIAIADVAPSIYPIDRLQREYEVVPHGPIYLLMLPGSSTVAQAAPGRK